MALPTDDETIIYFEGLSVRDTTDELSFLREEWLDALLTSHVYIGIYTPKVME